MKTKNIFAAIAATMLLVACSPITSSSTSSESSTTTESTTTESSTTTETSTTTSTTTETPDIESALTINALEGVTTVAVFNGEVQLDSASLLSIKEGTELVARVNVADHFEVGEVKLDDVALTYSDIDAGYPFVMPNKDATLTASANQVEFMILGVYDYQTNFDSVVSVAGEEVVAGQYVRSGSEISVTVSSEYSFDYYYSGIYLHVNDDVYTITEDLSDGSVSSYEFKVAMPSADTTIVITYNSGLSVSGSGNTIDFDLSEGFKVYGWGEGHLYDGFSTFTIVRKPGYKIDSIKYQREGSEDWLTMSVPTFTNDVATLNVMPNIFAGSNITIEISGTYVGVYNINYVNADKIVFGTYDITATQAIPGDDILTSQIQGVEGYRITSIDFEGVETTASQNSYSGYWGYNFTMPNNDVTITFNVSEITYAEFDITTDGGVQSYYVSTKQYSYSESDAIDKAESGSKIYIYVTVNTGYALGNATLTKTDGGEETIAPRSYPANSYELTMPSDGSNLVLSIATTKTYQVSIEANENVNNIYGYPKYFAAGSTVEIYFNPASALYSIDNVTVKELPDFDTGWDGKKVSFAMPEQNITLVTTTSEKETMSVDFTITDPNGDLLSVALVQDRWTNATESATGLKILANYTVSVNVQAKHGYKPVLSYVASGETTEKTFNSANNCNFSFSFSAPENLTEINLGVAALDKVNVIIDDQTGDNVEGSLLVNGVEGTIDNVYLYDSVTYNVTTAKPEGHIYVVSYYATINGEKTELSGSYYGITLEYDNLTIEITKVAVSTLTINSVSEITVNVWNNTTYSSLSNGSVINAGDVLNVDLYNYSSSDIEVVVTVSNNGETSTDTVTVPSYYVGWSGYTLDDIVVAGDVTITVTLAA